ncbi:MAG TPA: enoyl-ACP reductase FabV [Thermoanaerobaculia bacterium]|nr:enoyl-ACP reductase FabV [Thermoanaerobaculia bacterium]
MPLEIVSSRLRGFICINAHPVGCAEAVALQVRRAKENPATAATASGGNALIVGASTGYGLASWITAAFSARMGTLGVFLERPPSEKKTATAGYYNAGAVLRMARSEGLRAGAINGDAFSNAVRQEVIEHVRRELGPLDLVVYSLASPVRVHPDDGRTIRSSLKPVGQPYTTRTIDLDKERLSAITLEPASPEEIADTVAVMGGDDLRRWVEALLEAKLLARGARVLAYSYIGPSLTWPIYRTGTIGQAKADLEKTVRALDARLAGEVSGHAWTSVNAAVVTQASSAIPGVPLYLALIAPILEKKGLLERPIDQILRLMKVHAGPGKTPAFDAEGRIRMDDWEMREDVQSVVAKGWNEVTPETLTALADLDGFKREFRRLFGFGVPGVDETRPVEIDVPLG